MNFILLSIFTMRLSRRQMRLQQRWRWVRGEEEEREEEREEEEGVGRGRMELGETRMNTLTSY